MKTVTKGNIPIQRKLYGKYKTANEIFKYERIKHPYHISISSFSIKEINNIEELNITKIKEKAIEIFYKYNNADTFYNSGNEIIVNKSGIRESIEKIYMSQEQRILLKEHLLVFSILGTIIEHATLVSQATEIKTRADIKYWNYYFDSLKINNKLYNIKFEVRPMSNGQNQYRVQRIEKAT